MARKSWAVKDRYKLKLNEESFNSSSKIFDSFKCVLKITVPDYR